MFTLNSVGAFISCFNYTALFRVIKVSSALLSTANPARLIPDCNDSLLHYSSSNSEFHILPRLFPLNSDVAGLTMVDLWLSSSFF